MGYTFSFRWQQCWARKRQAKNIIWGGTHTGQWASTVSALKSLQTTWWLSQGKHLCLFKRIEYFLRYVYSIQTSLDTSWVLIGRETEDCVLEQYGMISQNRRVAKIIKYKRTEVVFVKSILKIHSDGSLPFTCCRTLGRKCTHHRPTSA